MYIEFRKDALLATDRTEISTKVVPRVGEVIETSTNTYLVHEVLYIFDSRTNGLTPLVYCHIADPRNHPQDRRNMLIELGWLHVRE
jgi:hypothetical protein